tara:strand:- start:7139 stop:7420 length:282 start_codon:yes stop_codon:yes gene_type:complete
MAKKSAINRAADAIVGAMKKKVKTCVKKCARSAFTTKKAPTEKQARSRVASAQKAVAGAIARDKRKQDAKQRKLDAAKARKAAKAAAKAAKAK